MRILYAGFKGKYNSARVLLDKIDVMTDDKLYLTNSFVTSEKELRRKLEHGVYDLIIGIGQLKLDKNVIRIEKFGRGEEDFETSYDYGKLKLDLEKEGFLVEESIRTNYLCNNIYYYGLRYIHEKKLLTKMIFIHVPKLDELDFVDRLAGVLTRL